jgi:hypothetical protein
MVLLCLHYVIDIRACWDEGIKTEVHLIPCVPSAATRRRRIGVVFSDGLEMLPDFVRVLSRHREMAA